VNEQTPINGTDLLESLPRDVWPALSIYLPTEKATTNGVASAVRLKNLLDEAKTRLAALEDAVPEPARLLAPASELLDDDEFWRHRAHGLAIFLAPGFMRTVDLPFGVPELVVVGRHFHVRPLLPLNIGDVRFWLLAISAGRVSLFTGNRSGLAPVEVPEMPASVGEISGETDFQESSNFNPIARPHMRGSPGVVKSHNYESPEEVRKIQLVEYLRRVDNAVSRFLGSDPAALVVAAEPEIRGHFLGLASFPNLNSDSIDVNPFAVDAAHLHARAYELLRPGFETPREELKDQIMARLGTAMPTVTLKLEEVLSAAAFSRVAGLLVAEDAEVWGRYDADRGLLAPHGTPSADDEDLVNLAAVEALTHGAPVFTLPRAEMPHQAIAAATLRY
jgi:hypothetical protein